MFTKTFSLPGATTDGYAYQTVTTPDPYNGTPVYSLLLLSLADQVAVDSVLFYDISRDASQAEAFCKRLVDGRVSPAQAEELLTEWLGEATLT